MNGPYGSIAVWDMSDGPRLAALNKTKFGKSYFSTARAALREGYFRAAQTQLADALDFHPDGGRLAGAYDNVVRIWDIKSGTQVCQDLSGHRTRIIELAYSPSGDLLATSGADGIRLWNPTTGEQISGPLPGGSTGLATGATRGQQMVFTSDERLLATSARKRLVRLWRLDGAKPMAPDSRSSGIKGT